MDTRLKLSLFYHELLTAMLFTAKCVIILLNDCSQSKTVLQDMFLVDMPMLLMSLI